MRVNSISPLNFKNAKPKFQKSCIKPLYQADSVSFTSKKQQPSEEFKKAVKDDYLRNEIINNVILTKRGRYRKEVENSYLNLYLTLKNIYLDEGEEFTPELENMFQEAVMYALIAVKDKDDFHFKSNNTALLAVSAYKAIEDGIARDDILKTFKICQDLDDEDKPIDSSTASIMLEIQSQFPFINPEESLKVLGRYFIKKDGTLDIENMPYVLQLFEMADVEDFKDMDIIFMLTCDENEDREINEDRTTFAMEMLYGLEKSVQKDMLEYNIDTYKEDIKAVIYYILTFMTDSFTSSNQKFDINKARESFKDWLSYAENNKGYLDNTLTLDIMFSGHKKPTKMTLAQLKNSSFERKPLIDTAVYRLFRIFSSENTKN